MKITALNYDIKRHPNSISMFRGEGSTSEERLYKSDSLVSIQDRTASVRKVYKSVNKTADLKSSGFFNVKNSPSFGCASGKAPQEMGKFAKKLADSKLVHKFLILAGKNPVVFEAIAALIVAGAIRPATIMALPASKADKEKNKKAASHSIASGVIGLVSTCILFQPIISAFTKLKDNPEKFGLDKKGPMFDCLNFTIKGVKNGKKRIDVYSDFLKYFPKVIFAPLTTWLTISLIPVIDKQVLNRIFSKNPAVKNAEMTPMDVYRSTSFKSNAGKNEKTFKSFTGGNV